MTRCRLLTGKFERMSMSKHWSYGRRFDSARDHQPRKRRSDTRMALKYYSVLGIPLAYGLGWFRQ